MNQEKSSNTRSSLSLNASLALGLLIAACAGAQWALLVAALRSWNVIAPALPWIAGSVVVLSGVRAAWSEMRRYRERAVACHSAIP